MKKIFPIILCGGVGTRLWPISRKTYPKQFFNFFDKNSLFQKTIQRVRNNKFNKPVIVTNSEYRYIIKEKLNEISSKPKSILLEPFSKNTAAAIIAAALFLESSEEDNDKVMVVLPSDHYIPDEKKFMDMINNSIKYLMKDEISTFGIGTTRAETGYGYINIDEKSLKNRLYKVKKFVEKPDINKATEFHNSNNYFWNSGIFIFYSKTILDLAKQHCPDIYDLVKLSFNLSKKENNFVELQKDEWKKINSISIDNAILENADSVYCSKFLGYWSDLGDWESVINEKNLIDRKITSENTTEIECKNTNLLSFDNKRIVGVGLDNITAVSVSDAILISNSSKKENIKEIVPLLNQKKIKEGNSFIREYRPWGWFESLINQKGYQVKKLYVYPFSKLSLQKHKFRSEHWIVVKGLASVEIENRTLEIESNNSTYINAGELHRLSNKTNKELIVIEVQTGSYLGEDDIVRIDDDYSRK